MSKRGKWIRTPEAIKNLSKAHIGNDSAHGKMKYPTKYEGMMFGNLKVVKFISEKFANENNKKRIYYYEVECVVCGSKCIKTLSQLQVNKANCKSGAKGFHCDNCKNMYYIEDALKNPEIRAQAQDAFIKNDKANKNNFSTGIKHLYARYKKNGVIEYRVKVSFDGKEIRLISTTNYDNAVKLVNELNNILKEGGKEAFYAWYYKEVK